MVAAMDYLDRLTDIELLALLVAGEASNQPLAGQVAVACVPVERLYRRMWGNNLRRIMLQKWQFGTFNDTHWQRFTPIMSHFIMLAECAIHNLLLSPTPSATHYHHVGILPAWAQSDRMIWINRIGEHNFYVEL